MPKLRLVVWYDFCSKCHTLLAVQKFWKSVKIWRSYREFKGGHFFETQYSTDNVDIRALLVSQIFQLSRNLVTFKEHANIKDFLVLTQARHQAVRPSQLWHSQSDQSSDVVLKDKLTVLGPGLESLTAPLDQPALHKMTCSLRLCLPRFTAIIYIICTEAVLGRTFQWWRSDAVSNTCACDINECNTKHWSCMTDNATQVYN